MANPINELLSSKDKEKLRDIISNSEKNYEKLINCLEENIRSKLSSLESLSAEFQLLLENSNDFICIVNEEFEFEYVNKKPYLEKLGFSAAELIGNSVLEFVHPSDQKKLINGFKEGFKQGEGSAELRFKSKNDKWIWLEAKGKTYKTENEETKGMVISKDITDKKEIHSKLLISQNKYKNIVENLFDVVMKTDLKGKIEYVSPQIYSNYGYRKEYIIGKKIFDYIHPDDFSQVAMQFKDLLINGKKTSMEYRVKKKDGTYTWVQSKGKIFTEKDQKKILGTMRNINEKKKTLKKLEKSKKKLKRKTEAQELLLDNIQTQVWYLTDPVTYGAVNEAHAKFNGCDKKDLAFKNIYDIFPNDVADICREGNIKVFSTKKQIHTEEWSPHFSGEKRLLSIIKTPKLNQMGKVEYVVCSAEDITEQKKYEEKIKESQRRLRLFIDSSPDMFFLKDENLAYLLVNKANAEFFGETEQHIIGKTDFAFMDESAANKCKETDLEAMNERRSIKSIEKVNDKIYETRKIPVIEEDKILGVAGIIRDITERKKAEKKLKESQENYREITELLPDIIYEADRLGNLIYVNSIGFEKMGYTKEDLEGGLKILDFISEEYKNKARINIKKLLNGKSLEPTEYLMVKKDGSSFYARIHSKPVYKENKIAGFRGTVSDIDKMIIAQEKIQESERKLKKLNQLKSELLRRTSHELKTPLVSIKGFTQLLLEIYSDDLDKNAIDIVNEILKGCGRLENLVKDILDTSRLESGRMQLKKDDINLEEIIKGAVASLDCIAESRKQLIELELDGRLQARGDKRKIVEVLENLISNAIKYTPANGKISVHSEKHNDMVLISIKDNGIGFTREEKRNLFTQFGKIERYGEGFDINVDGSGLGLYISKKIVELHGGKIWMESKGRNKGSTFYFSLPIKE